jgi:hypothetical protein
LAERSESIIRRSILNVRCSKDTYSYRAKASIAFFWENGANELVAAAADPLDAAQRRDRVESQDVIE